MTERGRRGRKEEEEGGKEGEKKGEEGRKEGEEGGKEGEKRREEGGKEGNQTCMRHALMKYCLENTRRDCKVYVVASRTNT